MMPEVTSAGIAETRACANCKNPFVIEPDDFSFYQRIKVPPPTWCPECRMKRRMVFRNERGLFKDTCKLCNKDIITLYNPDAGVVVYCNECWWSDKWDAAEYAKDYDFTRPFLDQLSGLLKVVPRMALEALQNENSPYTNYTWFAKNVYLSPSTMYSENVMYSHGVTRCEDIVDCVYIDGSQLCYETVDSDKCSNSRYLYSCRECIDSAFLYDCRGCRSCFMSSGLRNKSFVFRNEQLTKEEYESRIKALGLGKYSSILACAAEFESLRTGSIHRFADIFKGANSTGNNLINVKNVRHGFTGFDSENVSYALRFYEIKDAADIYGSGNGAEFLYDGVNIGYRDSLVRLSTNTYEVIRDATYCDYFRTSQNIFGCVGLRGKQYCILNRPYSKEEYEALVPKIIAHMDAMPYKDSKGRVYGFGELYPSEFSPFSYNESIAQEYFPLTEGQAREQGFLWRPQTGRDYRITVAAEDLPDDIADVSEAITKETVGCEHHAACDDPCTTAFRITDAELQFYKRIGAPLPRLCPNCRHYRKARYRNPLNVELWHRKCMCAEQGNGHAHQGSCPNEFETPYAPGRPERIYCEQCYNAEIA